MRCSGSERSATIRPHSGQKLGWMATEVAFQRGREAAGMASCVGAPPFWNELSRLAASGMALPASLRQARCGLLPAPIMAEPRRAGYMAGLLLYMSDHWRFTSAKLLVTGPKR